MNILAPLVGAGRGSIVASRSEIFRQGATLSTQVTGSRYFFLDLTGTKRGGVVPAYGGFEQCDPDYLIQREKPDFPALELVVAGRGTLCMNGVTTPLVPGTLFHYDHRTQLEIRTDPLQPMAKYFLCLTGTGARDRLRGAGVRPNAVVSLAMFTEVQRVWEELLREGRQHGSTAERICAALVEVLLLKIEGLSNRSGEKGQWSEKVFLRCKGVIETEALQLRTLGDITKAVGVGASQISRLFRRYENTSPYQYLLRRKMAVAAERLMDPSTLVKEAAAYVGFTDPYHFSRCFKQVHHVAPKEFQRSLKHL